jgi:nitroreductase
MAIRLRVRQLFDGLGAYVGWALVCVILSGFGVLVVAQDSSRLLWTGHRISAERVNGLAVYSVNGQTYSFSLPGPATADTGQVAIYYDDKDPQHAVLDNFADRFIDVAYVVVPLLLAASVLGIGFTRRGWMRRRSDRLALSRSEKIFGQGLDPGFVAEVLEQRRRSS